MSNTIVFDNAYFWANGVDLSNAVQNVTLNYSAVMLDETAMGNLTKVNKGGLLQWSMDVNFHQQYTGILVDSTLFGLVGAAAFAVEVRPLNSCSTAVNPRYYGNAVLATYPPLGGNVGVLLDAKAQFQSAGTLSRASSSF